MMNETCKLFGSFEIHVHFNYLFCINCMTIPENVGKIQKVSEKSKKIQNVSENFTKIQKN